MSTLPARLIPSSALRRCDNSPNLADHEAQGDGPPPSSPSAKKIHAPANNPSEKCNEFIEWEDERTCTRLRDEIAFLMVVAGLFLAIVTAFTVESYKSLQEDKQDATSVLLVEVVRLLNDTSAQGKAQLPKQFMPNHHDIVVNQLWFLSLILNLTAVAIGTFCLQWISAFSRGSDLKNKSVSPHLSLALRTLRYEGLVAWGVLHAPEALLLIVQLSIGLFTFGLIYFLWNVNNTTAIPALVAVVLTAVVLLVMNVMPFLQSLVGVFIPKSSFLPQCPYKSPTSWLIQSIGNVLPYILKLFLRLLQPSGSDWTTRDFGKRLGNLPFPFTDFFWKKHDFFCAGLREMRSYSWKNGDPPLRYYEQGLVSAIPHLIYQSGADNLISTCLQDLQRVFLSSKHWEGFFQWKLKLSATEVKVLDNKYDFALDHLPPEIDADIQRQVAFGVKIRELFLNALILQHFSKRIPKLATLLMYHRIQLYIQFKKSTKCIAGDNKFGQAVECPFQGSSGPQNLTLGEAVFKSTSPISPLTAENYVDLRVRFLECVEDLLISGFGKRYNDNDLLSAFAIVQTEGGVYPTSLSNNEELEAQTPSTPTIGTHNGLYYQSPSSPSNGALEEDSELRATFTRLCSKMRRKLLDLQPSAFHDVKNYNELHHNIMRCESLRGGEVGQETDV